MSRAKPENTQSRRASRARLLEAAESLFVEKGYQQVSIRDIAKAAGFSTGASHYHFSSKRELFLVVIQNRSESLVNALGERLDEIAYTAATRALTARDIIGAFTAGAFAAHQGEKSGRRLGRLMVHLVIAENRDEFAASFLEILGPLYDRYLAMLFTALPQRDPVQIEACFHFAQLVLMGILSDLHPFLSLIKPGEEKPDDQGLEHLVVSFLAAGFESLLIYEPATAS